MLRSKFKIIFFLVFFLNNNLIADINNRIIAKIGDEIITGFDVENKIKTNLFLSGEEINQANVDKIKTATIDSLVNLKLKSNEVKKHDIPTNTQVINQYIESITNNLNLSKIDLIKQFEINEIDYAQFLKDIEIEFLWQRLVAKTYLDKIKVNNNQIELELREVIKKEEKNKLIEEINLSEIEVVIENEMEEKILIKKVTDDINIVGFEKTAVRFSNSPTAQNGGNLGWVRSDKISKKIYNVIRNLKVGEVSEPIKQGKVITFLKINKKKTIESNSKIDIDNLRNAIENKMKNELLNLYSNSHLSKIKNITLVEFL